MKNKFEKFNIDAYTFIPGVIISIFLLGIMILNPESSKEVTSKILTYLTTNLGWLYSLIYILSFVMVIYIIFSKFGNIKLGKKDEEPEFSNFSWITMIFAAGVGITLMLFGFLEPIMYLSETPFNIEPFSDEAYEWAHMYSQFHWGISAWAFYVPIAIPVAYYVHVRNKKDVKISAVCENVINKKMSKVVNPCIEVIVIFGILGGIGTSLGVAVPVISAMISDILNVSDTMTLKLIIITLWIVLLMFCVYKGVDRGIKVLSNINILLAVLFVIFVFLVGPKLFILEMQTNSVGLYLNNIVRMSFWTDPITETGFFEDWTAFYWGWWLSFAPMMGLFIAKISRGRTIKQVSVGMIVWGTLGSCFFFSILGGYALYLQKNGILDVATIYSMYGQEKAVIEILKTMPFSDIVLVCYVVIGFIFVATTINSAAYVLASVSSKDLSNKKEPSKPNRLIWAFILGLVGIALVVIGGIEAAQSSAIIGGTPMILIYLILIISLKRMVKADWPEFFTKKEIYSLQDKENKG